MINLYVIDDHFLIGSGFKEEFHPETDEVDVIGCSVNVHLAIEKIRHSKTDIIILYLFIKFLDPIKNFRQLKSTFPLIPIVIISYENSLEWQVKMFNEGAKAFLNKNDDKETMKDVFHEVASGKAIIPVEVLNANGSKFNNIPKPVLLTQEKEIIADLSKGNTIKEIAISSNRTSSSIEKILRNVREKFNAMTNYELLIFLAKAKKI